MATITASDIHYDGESKLLVGFSEATLGIEVLGFFIWRNPHMEFPSKHLAVLDLKKQSGLKITPSTEEFFGVKIDSCP